MRVVTNIYSFTVVREGVALLTFLFRKSSENFSSELMIADTSQTGSTQLTESMRINFGGAIYRLIRRTTWAQAQLSYHTSQLVVNDEVTSF